MAEERSSACQDALTGPEDEHEVSGLDLLIVLVERKGVICACTAGFALVSLVISLLLPSHYTATVTILLPQQNTSMSSILTAQLGSMAALAGGSLGVKNSTDMYVALFKSRTVEEAMVLQFGLMNSYREPYLSDACKEFEKNTAISSGKDGLLHISVTDRDRGRAAAMANAYVDQYRALSGHLAVTEAARRRLFFQQQLEEAKDKLADADEALKETEQKTGLIEVSSQAKALIETAALLRAKVSAQEVIVRGMQMYATEQNAQLLQAQQQLASLRSQLAQLGGSESSGSELIVPKGKIPEAGMEYLHKLRDVKYQETVFEILARQFEAAKLDEAKEGALIQVVDSAAVPDRKSSPKQGLIVAGSTFAGLLLSCLLACMQAAWGNLRTDSEFMQKWATLRTQLRFRKSTTNKISQ
jgi:tyrosine-protein kinase Etk/Wzc